MALALLAVCAMFSHRLRQLAVLSLLAACGSGQQLAVDGQVDVDGAIAGDAPAQGALGVTVAPGTLRLRPSTTETLEVALVIGAGVGEVVVSATGLPAGVSIASHTIASSATVELSIVTAPNAAPLAAPVEITLTASPVAEPTRQEHATKPVLVAGLPGTLDTSLDQDGELVVPLSALSGDGSFAKDYAFYLTDHTLSAAVRFKPNGTRDTSFVMQGPASGTSFRVVPVDATSVAIVRGFIGGQDVALHSATGQRLASFNGGSTLALPFASQARFEAGALWIMGSSNPNRGRFATVNLAGTLTNITTTDAFGMDSYRSFALDATKRITFGGERELSAAIGRLTPAGQVDATFSGDGFFEILSPFANVSQVGPITAQVAIAPDGSGHALLTFFSTSVNVGPRSQLLAFSSTGAITVPPFDVTTTSLESLAMILARQADGTLLVAGKDAGVGFVSRYLANGQLDASFGAAGRVVLPRAPDALHLFVEDGRAVLTSNDTTNGALHVYRVWL